MTEPTEPSPAEPTDADDAVDDDTPQTIEAARKLRAENKNLRARLKAMETDYEAAATRLAAMQHAEVERIAGTVLIDPADVWRAAPDDQQFYDEQFHDVTADKVIEAAKKLAAEKPHLAKPPTAPPPSNRPIEGLRSGARPEEPTPTPTWADAIRGTGR